MHNREVLLVQRLEEEQKLGFYTEFFVETGFLNEDGPRFRAGNESLAFDLASLTKALCTAPLFYHHFKEQLYIPLIDGIFASHTKAFSSEIRSLTPFELLVHRSGLPAWKNFWIGSLNAGALPPTRDAFLRIEETFRRVNVSPEKGDLYSDLGYILLGYLLAKGKELSLDHLWSEFCSSIGFTSNRIGFAQQISQTRSAFVPSAYCAVRKRLLQGEVHDENSAALGGVTGHAGLFARGPEVSQYLRCLIRSKGGKAFLQANEDERQKHSFEGLLGLRRGAGVSAAPFAEGQSIGHLGFVGTAFWLHQPTLRYAVFLSNRVISGRVNPHITDLRKEVFGALHDILKL